MSSASIRKKLISDYKKYSVKKLLAIMEKTSKSNNEMLVKIKELEEKLKIQEEIERKLLENWVEIKKIKSDDYNSKNILKQIFSPNSLSEEAINKINILTSKTNDLINQKEDQSILYKKIKFYKSIIKFNNWKHDLAEQSIPIAKENEKLEQIKKDKLNEKMAIVAAHFGQTRKLAADIKKQLKKFEFCPYCQKLINDTPVADHIYPVSKGGLSTKENMVYICKTCNSKKSNNTLREFIIKYNLDRNKIEEVLEQLKKKF